MKTEYLIGNKETFALEFKARPERPSYHLFGWLRLWLGGKYVGAYESIFMLDVTLLALEHLLKSNLDTDFFEGWSKEEIYRYIKYIDEPEAELGRGKYWFTPGEDNFDDFSIVVFSHNDVYKFVWQRYEDSFYEYKEYPKGFQSAEVPRSEIEQVAEDFRKQLYQLDKEIPIHKRSEESNERNS